MVSRAKPRQGAVERDAALLEAIEARGRVERAVDVLLDDDERRALAADGAEPRIDVADDDRRQAERQLVAQQEARVRHQRAADRRHLLLPARERRGRHGAALGQHGKELVDAGERPRAAAAAIAADQQILLDREAREELAPLRHHGDAAADDLVRRAGRRSAAPSNSTSRAAQRSAPAIARRKWFCRRRWRR